MALSQSPAFPSAVSRCTDILGLSDLLQGLVVQGAAGLDSWCLSCDRQQVAFLHIDCHLPSPLPALEFPKFVLEIGGISEGADVGIHYGVGGKQSSSGLDAITQVVDVYNTHRSKTTWG